MKSERMGKFGMAVASAFSVLFALLAFISVGIGIASAATIYVPDDYAKIQWAIDNASAGDTVFVYNGTYYERITMKDGVTLQGEGADVTTVDGNKSGPVIVFYSIINAKIDGFTIRNAGFGYRSGIYCNNCSPTISNNTIIDNGQGILCCYSAAPIIDNNIISNNGGSGIDCKSSSSPKINNNIIKDNFWGIYCGDYSSAMISNNIITNNTARGITCASSFPTIIGNVITNNGGGILCSNSSAMINLTPTPIK